MAHGNEERPHWPYRNADGRKKDEEVFLPAPIVKGDQAQLVGVLGSTLNNIIRLLRLATRIKI
jgi:hypothetical protein